MSIEMIFKMIFAGAPCGVFMGIVVWFELSLALGWWINTDTILFGLVCLAIGEAIALACCWFDSKGEYRAAGLVAIKEDMETEGERVE